MLLNTVGLTASCGGNITADGGLAVTARGVCWAIGTTPTINNNITSNGAGGGSFTSTLTNLLPNTSYFVRAYATNDAGTAYGITYSLTTFTLPTVLTNSIISITGLTAISGGNITSDGGAAVTQRGVCWSTSPNPTITNNTTSNGSGIGNFTSNMIGLSPSTTYYVRAYAINIVGVSYGNEVSFTTEDIVTNPGAGVSFDGYNYSSIVLGNGQEWMNENLRTTNYANGDPIPNITNNTQWQTLTTGAWTHYNNNSQNEIPYGKLYNWYAASDSRNVCPIGWHVPSNDEWILLVDYLGGLTVAGGKMKSTGTQYWISPNQDATNESGFSALPGGIYTNNFYSIGVDGCWWASTEVPTDSAWLKFIGASGGTLAEGPNFKWFGTS
ncbi:MAG: hypothetical protein EBU61_06730, partial [Crocinitomicaceae bacterium]|nr:hypothetical protein [Crocinitomicaceae bacterium]